MLVIKASGAHQGVHKIRRSEIISNGSIVSVADGQCMCIVDQGKVVEFCAVQVSSFMILLPSLHFYTEISVIVL